MNATDQGMHPVTYLGDEATAAAFSLAGVKARAPAPGDEHAAFAQACEDSKLVLLGTRFAMTLPPNALENALASLAPLVAIIHDAEGNPAVPNPAAKARRQLGID
jgi:vacuolar-type H+-ATPase subunit F/Vma7